MSHRRYSTVLVGIIPSRSKFPHTDQSNVLYIHSAFPYAKVYKGVPVNDWRKLVTGSLVEVGEGVGKEMPYSIVIVLFEESQD